MSILRAVSVSGGKDSTAMALLALDQFPSEQVRFLFADTGNEHQSTYEYVHGYLTDRIGPITTVRADFTDRIAAKRDYVRTIWPSKGVSSSIVDRALSALVPSGVPFLDLCLWKGRFPSRKRQFCTQELKTHPLGAAQLDLMTVSHAALCIF